MSSWLNMDRSGKSGGIHRTPDASRGSRVHRISRTVWSAAYSAALVAVLPGLSTQYLCAGPRDNATSWKTNQFVTEPISRVDAINIALRQNPSIRKAQTDLE